MVDTRNLCSHLSTTCILNKLRNVEFPGLVLIKEINAKNISVSFLHNLEVEIAGCRFQVSAVVVDMDGDCLLGLDFNLMHKLNICSPDNIYMIYICLYV